MGVVFWKELADHFSSRRFMILLALIVLIGLWATYASGQAIRQDTENSPTQYVFLFLLTSGTGTVFSLATFLGFFGPLVAACAFSLPFSSSPAITHLLLVWADGPSGRWH